MSRTEKKSCKPVKIWKKMVAAIFFVVSAVLFFFFFLPKHMKGKREHRSVFA